MTLLAIAEVLQRALENAADELKAQKGHDRVVYRARVGKQTFIITCEEAAHDRQEPPV